MAGALGIHDCLVKGISKEAPHCSSSTCMCVVCGNAKIKQKEGARGEASRPLHAHIEICLWVGGVCAADSVRINYQSRGRLASALILVNGCHPQTTPCALLAARKLSHTGNAHFPLSYSAISAAHTL